MLQEITSLKFVIEVQQRETRHERLDNVFDISQENWLEFSQDCKNVVGSHITHYHSQSVVINDELLIFSFKNNAFIFCLLFNDIEFTDNRMDKIDVINVGSRNNDTKRMLRNVARNHNVNVNNNVNNNWNNNDNNNGSNNDDSESEEKIDDNLLFLAIDDFEDELITMGITFGAAIAFYLGALAGHIM